MENNKNAQNDKYTINISCFFYITGTFVPSSAGRFIIFIAEINTHKHNSMREGYRVGNIKQGLSDLDDATISYIYIDQINKR